MQVKGTQTRHGYLLHFAADSFVGRSLDLYGEYSEDELNVYRRCLIPGDVAVVVGANIGALVVPLARIVGSEGHVHAFEPQPSTCQLLRENLVLNKIENVTVHQCAVGEENGTTEMPSLDRLPHNNIGGIEIGSGDLKVPVQTLDYVLRELDKLNFIHVDAEGSELRVLKGAWRTIKKHRPILYVENDRQDKSLDLIGWLVDHDYRCYWHRPPLFNPDNFRAEKKNVFGGIVSQNMVCCPGERKVEVRGLDEVADMRVDPQMYERELKRFEREAERHPTDLTARLLVAHYASLLNRREEGRKAAEANLQIDPNHAPTKAILGLWDLQDGNWEKGWPAYELRYTQKEAHAFGARKHAVPPWDGSPTNQPVLIWCEQGFGDSIMFARFMQKVLEIAPNAIIEVQPQLFELFELSNICPAGVTGSGRFYHPGIYRQGRTLPEYKFHCSLPSVPAALKLYSDDQLRSPPYIQAEPNMVRKWKEKHPDLRVGICWKGSPRSERPYSRDIPIEALEEITRKCSPFLSLTQEGQFESFTDTAAAVEAMDLILSVDTSVIHLAGAMGKPAFLLLSQDSDWRWGIGPTKRKSLWYDSVTIFQQRKFLDWSDVIEDVSNALDEIADAKKNQRITDLQSKNRTISVEG